jgi:hypothetical protein
MIAIIQFGNWGVESSGSIRVTENAYDCYAIFQGDAY